MNSAVFYSKAALNGDRTNAEIATRLKMSESTVVNKIKGKTKWTIEDIANLTFAWNLSPQDVYDIWLKERDCVG